MVELSCSYLKAEESISISASVSAPESESEVAVEITQEFQGDYDRIVKKPRRPRRQPLLALNDRQIGTDCSVKDFSKQLLKANALSGREKRELFDNIYAEFTKFLANANKNWREEESVRRFSVFGDYVTCARWSGQNLISGVDVVKAITALYRLVNNGSSPKDRIRFEEGIASDLRTLKGDNVLIENSNSKLLKFLYTINCVRTHKRQKVYVWEAVPFSALHRDSLIREGRTVNPTLSQHHSKRSMIQNAHKSGLRILSIKESPTFDGDGSSPRSWSSHSSDGHRQFKCQDCPQENLCGKDMGLEIAKLAMVADAALAWSEKKRRFTEEAIELAPVRQTIETNEQIDYLPNLQSILP